MKKIIDYYDDKKWKRTSGVREELLSRENLVLDRLSKHPKKIRRFLDIGCGDGFFMENIKRNLNIKEVVGIEYSLYKISHKRTTSKIIRANIETDLNKKIKNDYFDCIYLGEVIEHVMNPDKLLRTCYKKLAKGGMLIISTPNLSCWYNRLLFLFGSQLVFYEVSTENSKIGFGILRSIKKDSIPVGHIRLFNLQSIKEMLIKEKFKCISIKGSPFESLPQPILTIDRIISKLFVSMSSDLVVIAQK